MEQQLLQEKRTATQVPNVLERFMDGLSSVVNTVLGRAPKSDPATRQVVSKELRVSNPGLANQVERSTSEVQISGSGHFQPARSTTEIVEPTATKKKS